jgi:hypothetical protein
MFWAPRKLQTQIEHMQYPSCKLVGEYRHSVSRLSVGLFLNKENKKQNTSAVYYKNILKPFIMYVHA